MNVLFVSVAWPKSGSYNLYSDLMSEFVEHGHSVFVASANNQCVKKKEITVENGIRVLRLASGRIQKTNKYAKVVNSFLSGVKIRKAIFKSFRGVKFDLLIFTTPPITMTMDIIRIKKHFDVPLYLLLKDIWPQDTVDIGGMRKGGIVWKAFRWLEIKIYKAADYIGCMSPASRKYLIKENSFIPENRIEVCPNCQKDRYSNTEKREDIRKRFSIPKDAVLFVLGGNIGVPQGIDFLFNVARQFKDNRNQYLLIVGDGTEFSRLKNGLLEIGAGNVCLCHSLDKFEYDSLVAESDVGLVLLHPNAEVPNFPSRLLSYIQFGKPVIAAVDAATDLGRILEYYRCGIDCRNGDIVKFMEAVSYYMISSNRNEAGQNARQLFLKCYTSDIGYRIIMNHFNGETIGDLQNEYAITG